MRQLARKRRELAGKNLKKQKRCVNHCEQLHISAPAPTQNDKTAQKQQKRQKNAKNIYNNTLNKIENNTAYR